MEKEKSSEKVTESGKKRILEVPELNVLADYEVKKKKDRNILIN